MKLFTSVLIVLVSQISAVQGVGSRGLSSVEPEGRILQKTQAGKNMKAGGGKGGKGTRPAPTPAPTSAPTPRPGPATCCAFIKEMLALDQACKAIVIATEASNLCGEFLPTPSPASQLATLTTEFGTFISDFVDGLFPVIPSDCFFQPITLQTFENWCTGATIDDLGNIDLFGVGPLEIVTFIFFLAAESQTRRI